MPSIEAATQRQGRTARPLTETQIRNLKAAAKPLKLAEPGGLYLLVKPSGTKLWRCRFRLDGKEGLLALGQYPEVSLAEARKLVRDARAQIAQGINPVHHRRQAQTERRANNFAALTESWQRRSEALISDATKAQRKREVTKYLLPKLGHFSISAISRPQLSALLTSVEAGSTLTKDRKPAPETARNLRSHLNAIFEHAIDVGATTTNPTPPRRILKPRRSTHHSAMPEGQLGRFLRSLDQSRIDPSTRTAMLLVLLTASRKTEVTSAKWDEFDLEQCTWIVPAERMKARQAHWIPLSQQACVLLGQLGVKRNGYLFPNRRDRSRPMADRSLNAVLERLGFGEHATPHGMRAVFSTHFNGLGANPEVIERCLAHTPVDKVRAAYNRHQYMEERRTMLQQWADHLDLLRTADA